MAKKYGAKKKGRGIEKKGNHVALPASVAGDVCQQYLRAFLKGDAAAVDKMLELARAGHVRAQQECVKQALAGALPDPDWNEAEQWCNQMLHTQPTEANLLLGCLYAPDLPGFDDAARAESYFQQGAELGSSACRQHLAQLYWKTRGREQDLQVLRALMETPGAGYASLYRDLADLCAAMNDSAAELSYLKRWHQAEPTHAECCCRIAKCYDEGRGCSPNDELAFKYYQHAARQGHVEAIYNVAMMLLDGIGTRPNAARAAELFRRAAEAGHGPSCYELASCYANANGVMPDQDEATRWLDEGVRLQDAICCLAVAEECIDGEFREPDREKAEHYISLALSYAKPEQAKDIQIRLDTIREKKQKEDLLNQVQEFVTETHDEALACLAQGDNEGFADICLRLLCIEQVSGHPLVLDLVKKALSLRSIMPQEKVTQLREKLRSLAKKDSDLAIVVGDMYYLGEGLVYNAKSAYRFYMYAWNMESSYEVALRLFLGFHEKVFRKRNIRTADWIDIFKVHCAHQPELLLLLGILYGIGLYVPRDKARSDYYLKAATMVGVEPLGETVLSDLQAGKITLRSVVLPESRSRTPLKSGMKQKTFDFLSE